MSAHSSPGLYEWEENWNHALCALLGLGGCPSWQNSTELFMHDVTILRDNSKCAEGRSFELFHVFIGYGR